MIAFDDRVLLALLPASLLLAVLAGWLSVVDARPLRFWAQYPWRVFWGSYVLSLVAPLPADPSAIYPALALMAVTLVVMYLSAVQGLRDSWRRSRVGGVLVLAGGFAIGAVGTVMRLLHTGEWHRLDFMLLVSFAVVAYWALMALVAERVARPLPGGDVATGP